jgi:hypothetical protein
MIRTDRKSAAHNFRMGQAHGLSNILTAGETIKKARLCAAKRGAEAAAAWLRGAASTAPHACQDAPEWPTGAAS